MSNKTLSLNEIAADLDALEAKDKHSAEKKESKRVEDKRVEEKNKEEKKISDKKAESKKYGDSFSKREEALKKSFHVEAEKKKGEDAHQHALESKHNDHNTNNKKSGVHSPLSTSKLDAIQQELDGATSVKEKYFGFFSRKKSKDSSPVHTSKNKQKSTADVSRPTRKEKQKARKLRNGQILRKYLDKAGYEELSESLVIKRVIQLAIMLCLLVTIGVIIFAAVEDTGARAPLIVSLGVWTGAFGGFLVLAWVSIYFFLDMRIYNRTMQIEEAFPDYLQLASANISAGMPIDRALWFAVRPRFGVLAKEMETVAKSTLSGEDIPVALRAFANKYDSTMIRRSISLLLEGMDAGGEIASLLNKISINIQETRILKKEMAANVMTYAIFIGFASVAAGPIMYALSGQLLKIIQGIMGMMAESGGGGSMGGMFSLSVTGSSITPADFQIFALVTVFMTSMFSAFIVSSIRKGDIKSGVKSLPLFVGASIVLYFIASWVLGKLLGGISAF